MIVTGIMYSTRLPLSGIPDAMIPIRGLVRFQEDLLGCPARPNRMGMCVSSHVGWFHPPRKVKYWKWLPRRARSAGSP